MPVLKKGSGIYLLRRYLIALLVVCFTIGLSFAETQDTLSRKLEKLSSLQGSFTFAVIGDTRSGGDEYRRLLLRLMERSPDLVVNTGDMVNSPDRRLWADFWKQSKPVSVPYFLVVGNHDVNDEKSENLYKDVVDLPGNELYYSFTVNDSLFIFLDSNIPGQERKITGDQYTWLQQVLSGSGRKHKFVFVHHPLYPGKGMGFHYGGCLDKYPEERDRLEALFKKFNVTMVFAGHEHLYLRNIVDGVTHIITGGGGAMLYEQEEKGGFHHFLLVTVDGNKVKGEVLDIRGIVKDAFQL